MPDKCGIDEDLDKLTLVSSNCTTWLIDMHPTWLEVNVLEELNIVPLDLRFHHMQLHVKWHVNIFHTHIHQRPLHIMDACQNYVMMDAMAGNQGTKQNTPISVSTRVFDYRRSWVANRLVPDPVARFAALAANLGSSLGGECPFYRGSQFTEELVALFQVFLLLSCYQALVPLLQDKVYRTFTIAFNFEDDLGS